MYFCSYVSTKQFSLLNVCCKSLPKPKAETCSKLFLTLQYNKIRKYGPTQDCNASTCAKIKGKKNPKLKGAN